MNIYKISMALICVLISGCVHSQNTATSEEMYVRASALTKLSAAIESTVRYKDTSPSLSDSELLKVATEQDSQLLSDMAGYKIRVFKHDRHAVLLICSESGDRALLEDAGCTGQLDRHHWQEPDRPCSFTLVVEDICRLNR